MKSSQITLHNDTDAITKEFKDYAYCVSHDLGAPVRAMVEFSKLLTSEHAQALDDEGKEYLSVIIENGQKLQTMMDGLLKYSRLNTMAKPFCEVHVSEVIDNCCIAFSNQIDSSCAEIKKSQLPTLHADVDQLILVFHALLDNALKFQPEGNTPRIEISAEEKGDYWQLSVADNGIGIDPQFQDKVFGLFQRLHTEEEYSGAGVGLTLAQKVVHRHGGKIWFESAVPQGTIFYFTLPKATG